MLALKLTYARKMKKKENILAIIVLIILMIIAIAIGIIKPNKTETTQIINQQQSEEKMIEEIQENIDINEINSQEEKQQSMQKGGTFCKIENQIVFYEDINKSIYLYNTEENTIKNIATLEQSADNIYFDGNNIYYLPYYYSGKGIYKIDLEGNITKISEETSLQLWITENEIYFVKQIGFDDMNQNPQGTICVMDKDGNNTIEIAENIKNYFYIENDKIYYTTQDRKMYSINIDGTNQTQLVEGRKFVNQISKNYLLYRDYANQEAIHILNLETNEENFIGYFGQIYNFQGKIYVNARKRSDDGSLEDEFTLFKVTENGSLQEIGQVAKFGTDIKYITYKGYAYIYNQQEGSSIINLETKQKEETDKIDGCRFFVAGYGYKLDDSNLEDIKIEKVEI